MNLIGRDPRSNGGTSLRRSALYGGFTQFETIEEGRVIVEAWRSAYKESRPHMAHMACRYDQCE
jgi:hypothetical protein